MCLSTLYMYLSVITDFTFALHKVFSMYHVYVCPFVLKSCNVNKTDLISLVFLLKEKIELDRCSID